MDAFVSRKRRRTTPPTDSAESASVTPGEDDDSTDFKLALLASLHPELDQSILLDALLTADGSVERASENLGDVRNTESPRKRPAVIGYQSSLSLYKIKNGNGGEPEGSKSKKLLSKKGKTVHLYSPEDIENNTPCSIIHNFLPADEADALLRELLNETPTYSRGSFKLFDRVVQSPHTFCFYVDSWDEAERQKNEYVYNGGAVKDVRCTLPEMNKAKAKVQAAVNAEIERRTEQFQNGKRLRYQSPHEWVPNASFVNCYDGGAESVGFHTDELTYLGPRAVIGSLSLGVAREFRVRRVMPRDDDDDNDDDEASAPASENNNSSTNNIGNGGKSPQKAESTPPPSKRRPTSTTSTSSTAAAAARADAQGQIAIHLPHNSLLIMHAGMQEEWKHAISPAPRIDPHPVAGARRVNVTYRHYRDAFHPRYTPRCRCGVATTLRCVQRKRGSRGRYMWMCHTGYRPDGDGRGCDFFQWAEFDEDGEPLWARAEEGAGGEGVRRGEKVEQGGKEVGGA